MTDSEQRFLKKITVHCSASPNGRHVSKDTIEQWHKSRGFDCIGYHFVIEIDGTIVEGRPLTRMGAHVEGENMGNVGICMVGLDKFTKAQIHALGMLVDQLCDKYIIPKWEVYTHNQFPSAIKQGKTCPGFNPNKLVHFITTGLNDALRDNLLD